jgi:hypothetical protein
MKVSQNHFNIHVRAGYRRWSVGAGGVVGVGRADQCRIGGLQRCRGYLEKNGSMVEKEIKLLDL